MIMKVLAACLGLACLAGQADAAQKAAVLPFEIIFQVREEDFFLRPSRSRTTRTNRSWRTAAEQLKALMKADGRYELVDDRRLDGRSAEAVSHLQVSV